ncbi:MAG: hypothetical protein KDD65_02265 [Bacteroidetes bacterium]|nr:hypothetical protein [Bacteroidota bacterium]
MLDMRVALLLGARNGVVRAVAVLKSIGQDQVKCTPNRPHFSSLFTPYRGQERVPLNQSDAITECRRAGIVIQVKMMFVLTILPKLIP